MQDSTFLLHPQQSSLWLLVASVFCRRSFGGELSWAQETNDQKGSHLQSNSTSGKQMFGDYCAPCHGLSGKGDGPAASALKIPPADLTQLAQEK